MEDQRQGCGVGVAAAGLQAISQDITQLRAAAKASQDEHAAAKYAHQLNCLSEAISLLKQRDTAAPAPQPQAPVHAPMLRSQYSTPTDIGAVSGQPGLVSTTPNDRPDLEQGDWACPACGNINWARRGACNRCSTAKPPPGQGPMPGAHFGGMPQRGGGGLQLGEQSFKPGDWSCVGCGNVNWHWRTNCNKCGTQKQESNQIRGPVHHQQQGLGDVPDAAPVALGAGGGAGRGPAPRPGDWQCPGCGNNNFARRDTCNRCGSMKGTAEELGGWGPGGASNIQTVPY
eukprot:TRINITY_DN4771_c0_g1_i1.p2 TRINITY_DN4771_c0_g1~~TRINITY_DN4771_c0_g1_i1.p2  ORF type:complete len:316 (+),score=84.52 TRINITY_DN4771_c0_g1_i1:91-948(+)